MKEDGRAIWFRQLNKSLETTFHKCYFLVTVELDCAVVILSRTHYSKLSA